MCQEEKDEEAEDPGRQKLSDEARGTGHSESRTGFGKWFFHIQEFLHLSWKLKAEKAKQGRPAWHPQEQEGQTFGGLGHSSRALVDSP